MTVGTPIIPDSTTQSGNAYKGNIDAGFGVLGRIAWAFAPHEQATPVMTVRLEAGFIPKVGATAVEVAAQSTGTVTAPSTNPRKDIVHVDAITGAVGVATGTESPTPVDPAVPAGKIAIARIKLATSTATITNFILDDLRSLYPFDIAGLVAETAPATGDEIAIEDASASVKRKMTLANVLKVINALAAEGSPVVGDFLLLYDTSTGTMKKVDFGNVGGGFPSSTKMLFQQTAAPTGWTKDTTHDNKALRVVTGTAGNAGVTAFTTVFGSGKTTGAHTLISAEMPSHDHTLTFGLTGSTGSPDVLNTGADTANVSTNSAGGSGSHDHTLSLDLQYVDMIIATKD